MLHTSTVHKTSKGGIYKNINTCLFLHYLDKRSFFAYFHVKLIIMGKNNFLLKELIFWGRLQKVHEFFRI